MKKSDYWFVIEPYVHIKITTNAILLYNTLDGQFVLSSKQKVISLMERYLSPANAGVIIVESTELEDDDIHSFMQEIRVKFMGDLIDTDFSFKKPIQIMPAVNSMNVNTLEMCIKQNYTSSTNILESLHKIRVYIGNKTDILQIIHFLQLVGKSIILDIRIIDEIENIKLISTFLQNYKGEKSITCSYKNVFDIKFPVNVHIEIDFPMDIECFLNVQEKIKNSQINPFYVFCIKSEEDYKEAEDMINEYHLDNYIVRPIYTGDNLSFFKRNVFLTKDDILTQKVSLPEIFQHQMINIFHFGELCIMPDGEVRSSIYTPTLGHIADDIKEMIAKEIQNGYSWLKIRRQPPCNNCVFQWLCPPPSEYEFLLGTPNLCTVN